MAEVIYEKSYAGGTTEISNITWSMVYEGVSLYTQEQINVSWARPIDGQVLNGLFYILVYPEDYDLGLDGEIVGSGGTGSG